MPRETSPWIVGDYWLDKRRDGKSPDVWQITRYNAATRSIVYRSTGKSALDEAKAALDAFVALQQAKTPQQADAARVIPLLFVYWDEKGRHNINHDQTGRSLRTFIGFLLQDAAGMNAVVTNLTPALFTRFRLWRAKAHKFSVPWDGQQYDYASPGVSGDTIDRNLNDIRAALNYAEANMRIPYAPKVKMVEKRYRSKGRERILSEHELALIFWYAKSQNVELFRFVALQMMTSVRPMAAMAFDPRHQYDQRHQLIDLQPKDAPATAKRNAIIPAVRPLRPVLRKWAEDGAKPVGSHKTAWRNMRRVLGLSADVFPKTIRHTIATRLYADPNVPEREISEMLGHEGNLRATSKRYVKYNPMRLAAACRALEAIWLDTSRRAKKIGAGHLLSKEGNGPRILIDLTSENT